MGQQLIDHSNSQTNVI